MNPQNTARFRLEGNILRFLDYFSRQEAVQFKLENNDRVNVAIDMVLSSAVERTKEASVLYFQGHLENSKVVTGWYDFTKGVGNIDLDPDEIFVTEDRATREFNTRDF